MTENNNVVAIGLNPFDSIGDAVQGAAGEFLNAIGASFCGMAANVSSSVFAFAADKTAFDVNASYLVENYNIVFGVSVMVLLALLLCSGILGALRGDPHIVTRAFAVTGTTIIGSFIALGLLQLVLDASDGLAEAFGNGDQLGNELVVMLDQLPDRGNFALSMVMSLMVTVFSFFLFVVLFVRKIAIIALAVFIPLYLAGQGTAVTQNWMRRASEMLAALIFVKPVIYAIFTLGADIALETAGGLEGQQPGSYTDQTLALLTFIALMLSSVLSPFALFRVIGFADVQLTRSVGSAGRRAAASFGHGAGALLGATSRDTFRGIGARLQTRQRGGIGVDASGGALAGSGGGGGLSTGGRPSTRPGRGTAPRTPARTSASPSRSGSAAGGGGGTRVPTGSATVAVAARAGRSGSAAGQRVRVNASGPRATAASARPAATRVAAPSVVQPAPRAAPQTPPRPTRTPSQPGRGGG